MIEITLPAGTVRTADYPRLILANLVNDINITDLTLSRTEELDKRTQPSHRHASTANAKVPLKLAQTVTCFVQSSNSLKATTFGVFPRP